MGMLIEVTLFLAVLWLSAISFYLRPALAIIRARNGK